MNGTVIPLKRRSKPTLTINRFVAAEQVLATDRENVFLDGTRVRRLLEDLRVRQDTLSR